MRGTLVLGIGNIFLSDEAVGVKLVQALEQRFHIPPEVDVIDGGTCGMELLDEMANRSHIIVADAVLSKKNPPGTILIMKDQEVPTMFTNKMSPHQLGLTDVLSALIMTDEFPKKLTLVGIVPECIDYNKPISQTVAQVFDGALDKIVSFIQEDGHTIKEKAVS